MGRRTTFSARGVFRFAGIMLIFGAVAVSVLTFRAANVERPDPNADVASETAARARAAAAAIDERLALVGHMLESLAAQGAGAPGGGEALGRAHTLFGKTRGLEQLAAYGADGRTLWVMRPADKGRIRFPETKRFVLNHMARPDLKLRLAAPFLPTKRDGWWSPLSLYVPGKSPEKAAVVVAFLRTETLQPDLGAAGDIVALFTDNGVLAAAEPPEDAPLGASFAQAPGFLKIEPGAISGAYVGESDAGPEQPTMVGYSRLACCGGIVTTVASIEPPPPLDVRPIGQWLALAAATLMIALGFVVVSKRVFAAPPDPWREFGSGKPQTLA